MKIEIELDELTIAKSCKLLGAGKYTVCGLVLEKDREIAILDGPRVTWFRRDEWRELTKEQF